MFGVIKLFYKANVTLHFLSFCCCFYILSCTTVLSSIPFFFPSPSAPSYPPNPSASCRSVRLPVSVPIRFHLIHVTSINTQSSPDKSRPLSPPSASAALLCIAHFLFPTSLRCHSCWAQCIKSHAGCTSS